MGLRGGSIIKLFTIAPNKMFKKGASSFCYPTLASQVLDFEWEAPYQSVKAAEGHSRESDVFLQKKPSNEKPINLIAYSRSLLFESK